MKGIPFGLGTWIIWFKIAKTDKMKRCAFKVILYKNQNVSNVIKGGCRGLEDVS